MPTTRVVSTTIVEFTKDEADQIVSGHLSALSPGGAQFERGRISFQLNQAAIYSALSGIIPGLPQQFNVSQVLNNPAVSLRVSFATPAT